MRRTPRSVFLLTLLLAACPKAPTNGDGPYGSTPADARASGGDGPAMNGDGPGAETDLSQAPMSCAEIRAAYDDLVSEKNRTCGVPEDCQLLGGQCGVGLGGCYHAVNKTVSQEQIDLLGTRFHDSGCFGAVCRCPGPPAVECRDRLCQPKL